MLGYACLLLKLAPLLLILVLLYVFVIRVYLQMRHLQKSFKFKTKLMFRPILGIQSLFLSNERKYNDAHAFFYKLSQEDPELKMLIVNIFTSPMMFILDPDMIKEVLMTHQDRYDKLLKSPISTIYLVGKSLIASRKEKWKQQRKCLSPSFSFEKLESSLPLIQEVINEKLADLDQRLNEDKPVKLVEEMGFITGEVVVRFFFGEQFTNKTINGNKCDREVEWLISVSLKEERRPLTLLKLFLFKKAYYSLSSWLLSPVQKAVVKRAEVFNEEISKVIQKRKDDIISDVKPKREEKFENLLTVLVKQHILKPEDLPFDEIIHEFILLYFAGMDTTAHWLALSIYCLAKYPEYKIKLREEVNKVCGKQEVTYKMLSELNFLRAFMNEVLRLYTPAAAMLPRICEEEHEFQGVKIPKGTAMNVSLLGTMRNQKYFPDPDSFKPERWLTEDVSKINSYAYIPFSAGPRNCIGQHLSALEAKLVIINLLRRYDFELNPKRELIMILSTLRAPKFEDLVFFKKLKSSAN